MTYRFGETMKINNISHLCVSQNNRKSEEVKLLTYGHIQRRERVKEE